MTGSVRFIDVTLRDAHQCLWATRMTTAMMKEVAPHLDEAGFEAIDLVGGAVFDVCVRYLREHPWERMRILSSWITRTPLIIRSEEHTSELQSLMRISYAVFCLKNKKITTNA